MARRLKRYRGVTLTCMRTDVQEDTTLLCGFGLSARKSPPPHAGGAHESHLYRDVGFVSAGYFAQMYVLPEAHIFYTPNSISTYA
jgi:hypothetical protein